MDRDKSMGITDGAVKSRCRHLSLSKRKRLKKLALEVKDMAIGNSSFRPSVIEDHIYDLIDDEEYIVSSSEYTEKCMDAVGVYLQREGVQWSSIWSDYQDQTGYSVSFAWIEAGRLHHIVLDCRKEGCY